MNSKSRQLINSDTEGFDGNAYAVHLQRTRDRMITETPSVAVLCDAQLIVIREST